LRSNNATGQKDTRDETSDRFRPGGQSLNIDLRTFRPLTKDARQKLAFWFLGNMVTGGTAPYLDLPEISFDGRSARGYSEGRYRETV